MGFSLVSGVLITLVLFFGVSFEEGAVGNSKCCFLDSLQINSTAIFLRVIPVHIKIMGITSYFHVDFFKAVEL